MRHILDEINEKYAEYLELDDVDSQALIISVLVSMLEAERKESLFYKHKVKFLENRRL